MDEGHSSQPQPTPDDPNDMMINPKKFGLPTFEEFKKNPSKYKLSDTHWLDVADKGQTLLKNVREHHYKIKSRTGIIYSCGSSIDKLAYIAGQEGYSLKQLKIISAELREDFSTHIILETTYGLPHHETKTKISGA